MLDDVPRLGDAPVSFLAKVLHSLLHVGLDDAANLNEQFVFLSAM